jgi:hypothetical protein
MPATGNAMAGGNLLPADKAPWLKGTRAILSVAHIACDNAGCIA